MPAEMKAKMEREEREANLQESLSQLTKKRRNFVEIYNRHCLTIEPNLLRLQRNSILLACKGSLPIHYQVSAFIFPLFHFHIFHTIDIDRLLPSQIVVGSTRNFSRFSVVAQFQALRYTSSQKLKSALLLIPFKANEPLKTSPPVQQVPLYIATNFKLPRKMSRLGELCNLSPIIYKFFPSSAPLSSSFVELPPLEHAYDFVIPQCFDLPTCFDLIENQSVVVGYGDGHIQLVHYHDDCRRAQIKVTKCSEEEITKIQFLPNGTRFIVAGHPNCLRMYSTTTRTLEPVVEYVGHRTHQRPHPINFSIKHSLLVMSGCDNLIRFWNLFTGELLMINDQYQSSLDFKEICAYFTDTFTFAAKPSAHSTTKQRLVTGPALVVLDSIKINIHSLFKI